MTDDGSVHATRIRVAEVIAASCLATDLGMVFLSSMADTRR
jgi:hypothetical protein